MNKADIREIKITLDDNIIKDIDSSGEEKLRLGLQCAGKTVYIRFPVYGLWDSYVTDVAQLLMILGQTTENLQIPELEIVDDREFYNWAKLSSIALRYKVCRELIDKIFFTYLRPEVELEYPKTPEDKIEDEYRQEYRNDWLRFHLNTAHIFQMFTSILYIDIWFKKKALIHLRVAFPELIQPSLKDISQKNTTSQQQLFIAGPSYDFN